MWAVGTASVLLTLAYCAADEAPLKWSKPASERSSNDWVPLSADQLGQASARSLGPPSQQNHLVHGLYQQDNANNFAQNYQQQSQFRPETGHQPQSKLVPPHGHVYTQQFLPQQLPPHLLSHQLPPEFLNQQFENNFNQFQQGRIVHGSQFISGQDQFNQNPIRDERPQQVHQVDDFVSEQKAPSVNLHNTNVNPPSSLFTPPHLNQRPAQNLESESLPKAQNQEKEEVQILYVPVETLKNRGKGQGPSKGTVLSQPVPQANPVHQVSVTQPSFSEKPKKFRHPIQPLKEQYSARDIPNVNADYLSKSKLAENPEPVQQQEYDSAKDTSQQITTSQLQYEQETKFRQPSQSQYNLRYPTEQPMFAQSNFRQYQEEKDLYTERPHADYDSSYNSRFSNIPSKPSDVVPNSPTEVYQDEVVSTTKLPPPNQPPLSVYMETSPNSKVGDVLSLLKNAKTIPVLDTIGPNSPQVFVGPSNLKPPHGYVKFELPYLSSLDGNRVERKVLQLPFFVAPLNFQPPPGYSKIPFPPPHIGSVVLSNNTAKTVTDKYASTPIPYSSHPATYNDIYTIPADISSISPQLPSLINSLQEEQYGPTTVSSPSPTEAYTVIPTEATTIPSTTTTRRAPNSRRNYHRGSQKGSTTTTQSPSSETKRPYGQRQRRPFTNRTHSRFNQGKTSTSTTTTEEAPASTYDQSITRENQEYKDQLTTHNHQNNHYLHTATQSTERSSDYYTPEYTGKESFVNNGDHQLDIDTKNKKFDTNQEFITQYNPEYYNEENVESGHKKVTVSSQNVPTSFESRFAHQSQSQSDADRSFYSSLDSQSPTHRPTHHEPHSHSSLDGQSPTHPPTHHEPHRHSSLDGQSPTHPSTHHEPHRQSIKSDLSEGEKFSKRPIFNEQTTESQYSPQYKETSDAIPFNVYDDPRLIVGQLPPEYSVNDFRTEPNLSELPQSSQIGSADREAISKQQNVPAYEGDYTPSHINDYSTQGAYQQPSQSDYKDYNSSPVLNRNSSPAPTTPVVTEPHFREEQTNKPEINYGSDEEIQPLNKHRLRGRPTNVHKNEDYTNKPVTQGNVEASTRGTTERASVSKSRGRVRGRPHYVRPKTTTEPPNYPSNFGESREQTPTESYKEENKGSDDSLSTTGTSSENIRYTTETPEATTRNFQRKFSNQRTVHRRPLRPTTQAPSYSSTITPTSGTKYLIRTRRPASTPQTKLNTGRSRIRRPTTPTTTTTTESTVAETERWTVPQLPSISYNDEESIYSSQLSNKNNHYDNSGRSPNLDVRYEPKQTTPTINSEAISSRYTERPKPKEITNVEHDHDTIPLTTRRLKPNPTSYDENVEYEQAFQDRSPAFKPREHLAVTQSYEDTEVHSGQPFETNKKSHHTHSDSYNNQNEKEERKKIRGKQRVAQPSTYYQDEGEEIYSHKHQDTTRRPLVKHRESYPTTPIYTERTRERTAQRTDELPQENIQRTESTSTFPIQNEDSNKNYKQYISSTKTPYYREYEQESEEKYKSGTPLLIPDVPIVEEKHKSKTAKQKEAEDFWNQDVTIQQSQSYVYTPEASVVSESPKKAKSKFAKDQTSFSEYDDYFGFQESDKSSTSDQSPFPSNDQQITYTGIKPDVNVGKSSQYPDKETNADLEKSHIAKENSQSVQDSFSTNERSSTVESSSQESVKEIEPKSSKKPGKRRGTWVRVRVKKTKDVFETAESQRFGALTSNSLSSSLNAKKSLEDWAQVKHEAENITNPNVNAEPSTNSTSSDNAPSMMDQFQNSLTSMIANYMTGSNEKENKEKSVENLVPVTTEVYEQITTMQTSTEEQQAYTTVQPIEDLPETTTDASFTAESTQTVAPKVLGTSTTTEISLETEICYKGRCVKTKRAKDSRAKDESDLMTVE